MVVGAPFSSVTIGTAGPILSVILFCVVSVRIYKGADRIISVAEEKAVEAVTEIGAMTLKALPMYYAMLFSVVVLGWQWLMSKFHKPEQRSLSSITNELPIPTSRKHNKIC